MEEIVILVIDVDQEGLVDLTEKIYKVFSNCKILMVSTRKKNIEIAEKEDPDIIFLDFDKEVTNQFELCGKLKSSHTLSEIPVVFIIGYCVDMEHRRLALKYGGDGFISKDENECELGTKILTLLKMKNSNIQKKNEQKQLEALVKKHYNALEMSHEQTRTLFKSLEKEYEIRRKSQKALQEAQKIAHLGNYEINVALEATTCSSEALRILGINSIEEIKTLKAWPRFIHPDDWTMVLEKIETINNKKVMEEAIFRIIKPDGEERCVQAKMVPQYDKNRNHIGSFGIIQDITEVKRTEEKMRYLSYYDHLTGLYNRRYFEEALIKIDCDENYPLALIMADINGLKVINDSFGHDTGDELLKKAVYVIKNGCRERDVIARLGGDEFAILLPQTNQKAAGEVVQRLEKLAAREKVRGIKLSLSFGMRIKTGKNECLKKLMKQAEDEMYRNKLYEKSSTRSKTVELIMNTLYEKNSREMMHSIRVGLICEKIGHSMKLDTDRINQVRTAGMIHDIGKIGIDEKILNKPDKLDEAEWKEIKRHPEIGYRILSSVNEFTDIANYVLEHHERWDGTGYPKGVAGQEISLQGRIVAVADSFDAMTSDRPYRKGRSTIEAVVEFRKNAGIQFDPDISKIFVESVLGMEF